MSRGKRVILFVALSAALLPGNRTVRGEDAEQLVIETASDHEDEKAVAEIVSRLIEQYDLTPWIFTKRIVVDRTARIPHSHPVLTLNTRYVDDEMEILTNIVHEQLHWFVLEDQEALGGAVTELHERYPDAPDGPPKGARDLRSTYLHLVVCSLEYIALEEKIGREAADMKLLSKTYYTWVFNTVVEDRTALRELLERHTLVLP